MGEIGRDGALYWCMGLGIGGAEVVTPCHVGCHGDGTRADECSTSRSLNRRVLWGHKVSHNELGVTNLVSRTWCSLGTQSV